MMLRMLRKVSAVFVILFVTLVLNLGSALAGDKEAVILWTGQLTGPGASLVRPLAEGIKNGIAEFNTQGGCDGVKIKFILTDDRYASARAMSFYQRYRKTPKLAFLYAAGTPSAYILYPIMKRDKLPLLTTGGGRFQKFPEWAFLVVNPYQNMVGSAIDWAIADWKKKGKPGMPAFGYIGWPGAAGNEAINGSAEYAKQKGVKWLPPVFTPPGTLKYDTWLTSLAQNGVNYIHLGMVDPDQTYAVRNAYALGLTKKIKMISGFYGLLDTVGLKMVEPEVVEGTIVQTPCCFGVDRLQHPLASYWTKYQKKALNEMPAYYLMGVGISQIMIEAVVLTLKQVGYDKFNGEAVFQVLQKLKGDITQGIMGPVEMNSSNRLFNTKIKFYSVTKGKNVPISGWTEAPDIISLAEYK